MCCDSVPEKRLLAADGLSFVAVSCDINRANDADPNEMAAMHPYLLANNHRAAN
jgi:hypothetical protein